MGKSDGIHIDGMIQNGEGEEGILLAKGGPFSIMYGYVQWFGAFSALP